MQLLSHRKSWISFAVALFACQVAQAEWAWIWSSDPAADAVELRQEFTVPAGARRANLTVASDNAARVFLNGEWQPAQAVGRYGDEPWGDTFGLGVGRPLVVQPDAIQVLPGFRVELLHVGP